MNTHSKLNNVEWEGRKSNFIRYAKYTHKIWRNESKHRSINIWKNWAFNPTYDFNYTETNICSHFLWTEKLIFFVLLGLSIDEFEEKISEKKNRCWSGFKERFCRCNPAFHFFKVVHMWAQFPLFDRNVRASGQRNNTKLQTSQAGPGSD